MHVRQKGVMTQAVYDPDKDGLIALAQLVAAVASDAELTTHEGLATVHQNAPALITTHAGVAAAHHAKTTSFADITDRAGLSKLEFTLNKILKGAGAGVSPTEIDMPTSAVFKEGTVADFQVNPATGTFTNNVVGVNSNNTANAARADNVDEYAEVDFGKVVELTQYRHYGEATNNGDGSWKIQYYNLSTHAWVDWVTGIATRGASWSGFSSPSNIATSKIRLVCTGLDSGAPNKSYCGELEVKY